MNITMNQALAITRQREGIFPKPFSAEFISYDSNESRSKGVSELVKIENAVRVKSSHDTKANASLSYKALGTHKLGTIHFKLLLKINGNWVL